MAFVLTRPAGSLVLKQAEVEAALARVLVDRRVEHIRVHASRAGARGVVFLVAPSHPAARALCDRWFTELGRDPLLRGWSGRVLTPSRD